MAAHATPTAGVAAIGVVAAVAVATAALFLLMQRKHKATKLVDSRRFESVRLSTCEKLPAELRVESYIDLAAAAARGYEHIDYLHAASNIVAVLDGLHDYATGWLNEAISKSDAEAVLFSNLELEPCCVIGCGEVHCQDGVGCFYPERLIGSSSSNSSHVLMVQAGARITGGTFDVSCGSVFVGAHASVEPGATLRGPAVVGAHCEIRHGAYVRGDVVLGASGVFGGELKGVLALDGAELPHGGYCGDSIIGHRAHFGCQALTANFPLFGARPSVIIGNLRYDLERRKLGAVVGDACQLGCNAVAEPAALFLPNTHAYPLCRLPAAVYGPDEIIKNSPLKSGVITRAPLRR